MLPLLLVLIVISFNQSSSAIPFQVVEENQVTHDFGSLNYQYQVLSDDDLVTNINYPYQIDFLLTDFVGDDWLISKLVISARPMSGALKNYQIPPTPVLELFFVDPAEIKSIHYRKNISISISSDNYDRGPGYNSSGFIITKIEMEFCDRSTCSDLAVFNNYDTVEITISKPALARSNYTDGSSGPFSGFPTYSPTRTFSEGVASTFDTSFRFDRTFFLLLAAMVITITGGIWLMIRINDS